MHTPKILLVLVSYVLLFHGTRLDRQRGILDRWSLWGTTTTKPSISRAPGKLSDDNLRSLVHITSADHNLFNETLSQILIPRVSGTPGNAKVRQFIVDNLRALDWDVEEHSFEDNTPLGRKPFVNILARLNPRACRQVTLACHYDSKFFPSFEFLGATDSAVPCTMLIELVRTLREPLKKFSESNELSLQLMFFDGEEAFNQWTATDSLYGSRRLALKLRQEVFARSDECFGARSGRTREIDRIELLVLLDLIGEEGPVFCNHFSNTKRVYDKLTTIEKRLQRLNLLEAKSSRTPYFPGSCFFSSGVEDDHVPFLRNNVKVVHLIATPFPNVWHQPGDNAGAVHHPTVNNLMKILKVFLVEHLQLQA